MSETDDHTQRLGDGMERYTPVFDRMFDPDHHLADEPACKRWAWADICHMAQYQERTRIVKGSVVQLPRGCFLASIRFLAKRWQWSRGKVERFLVILQHPKINKIETVGETRVGTVYSVVSYDEWRPPRDSERDSNATTPGPPTGHQRATDGTKNRSNRSKEPIGDASEKPATRATRLPDSWKPSEEHEERARQSGLVLAVEVEKFRAHAEETGRTAKVWNAAFTRWLMNAEEYAKRDGRLNGKAKPPTSHRHRLRAPTTGDES